MRSLILVVLLSCGFTGARDAGLNPLDLINSSIVPGGQYGFSLNTRALLHGDISREAFVEMMTAADEDIHEFLNSWDPNPPLSWMRTTNYTDAKGVSTPWKDMPYKARLAGLKDMKTIYYSGHYDALLSDRDMSRLEGVNRKGEAAEHKKSKSPPKKTKVRKSKLEDIDKAI